MTITIMGHEIKIIGVDDFDYTKGNDQFIYKINDSILEGQVDGDVVIDDVSYQWEIIQKIDQDEYENICFENKMMGKFLEKLGYSVEEITSFIINGSSSDIDKMLERHIKN